MAGYFGTDTQQRLQAQAEASAEFIASTPGACQAGRTMGCDDPRIFGWDRIDEILGRDGACGFRLIDTDNVDDIRSELESRGCRFDTWDVFIADHDTALAASKRLVDRPLVDGYFLLPTPNAAESKQVKDLQAMMASAGLVPFSGSMLTGEIASATTIAITDADANVVSTAHGYMPHNAYSPYRQYAWGGLVAVAESCRGQGLGKYVNALMIERVFQELGASHVYELVSASNLPSRRMVEACGLRLEPTLTCGIATHRESARFTK
ncbi:GNAT family N-acetyltransferase [Rhizobium brockwellii]|uniref:GNAT family N-acetyltransferase n=1 Tax=Rhizobium brockwellii TaxID=3019932 RepID=UPI003F9C41A6